MRTLDCDGLLHRIPLSVAAVVTLAVAIAAGGCASKERLTLGAPCHLDSDCAPSLACKFGACHRQCAVSRDCPGGGLCVAVDGVGVCQSVQEGACDERLACAAPLRCGPDRMCRNTCEGDNNCDRTQRCVRSFCLEMADAATDATGATPGTTDRRDGRADDDVASPGPDAAPDVPRPLPSAPADASLDAPPDVSPLASDASQDAPAPDAPLALPMTDAGGDAPSTAPLVADAGVPDLAFDAPGCPPPPVGCERGEGTSCESTAVALLCRRDNAGCLSAPTRLDCPTGRPCVGAFPGASCSCPTPPPECMGRTGRFCTMGQLGECTADPVTSCISITRTSACGAGQLCKGVLPDATCACVATNVGEACGACGGMVQCDGSCSKPSACAGGDGCCPPSCTYMNDSDCKKPAGVTCGAQAECASGTTCTDGVCCAQSCSPCQECTGAGGTCVPVAKGQPDLPGNACVGPASTCDGAGACKKTNGQACGTDGSLCASGNCVDGVCCDTTCGAPCAACAGNGVTAGTCTVSAVKGADDGACMGTDTCDPTGACRKKNGVACQQPTECASGKCVDGVCCGASVCGTCESCNAATPGTCTSVKFADDLDSCPAGSTCEGGGLCKKRFGTTCGGSGECLSGACSGTCVPPSCLGLGNICGPSGNESCCASPVVTGATYDRNNDPARPATISSFRLDRFEITVGRFRKFVAAWNGGWRPAAGDGKHAHLNGGKGLNAVSGGYEPGWDPAWGASLPTTSSGWNSALGCGGASNWTNAPGGNEARPANCISWNEAAAFCVWDGGFLPTKEERIYAHTGGSDNRLYPWGPNVPDGTYAVFCGSDCSGTRDVGSKSPKGDGRYGQADLGGNVWEWNLDFDGGRPANCIDCAVTVGVNGDRGMRGGSFVNAESELRTGAEGATVQTFRHHANGARCARGM